MYKINKNDFFSSGPSNIYKTSNVASLENTEVDHTKISFTENEI